MKIKIIYKYYKESDKIRRILLKKKRKLKKDITKALLEPSKTLGINEWEVFVLVRNSKPGLFWLEIISNSKDKKINGYLTFIDKKNLDINKFSIDDINHLLYSEDDKKFINDPFNNSTIFLVVNSYNTKDFKSLKNNKINSFIDYINAFNDYIKKENLYNPSPCKKIALKSRVFYISKNIYWTDYYSHNTNTNFSIAESKYSNIHTIEYYDEKTIVRSMIEARIISINQDIDDVLTWDIKDIFAMSKLIGY
jgi:hypothetical protein